MCSYIVFAKMNLCIFCTSLFCVLWEYQSVQIMHKLEEDKMRERYKGRGYEHMDDTWNRADR